MTNEVICDIQKTDKEFQLNRLRKENLILQGKTYAWLSIAMNSEVYRVQAERCLWLLKKMELSEKKLLTEKEITDIIEIDILEEKVS